METKTMTFTVVTVLVMVTCFHGQETFGMEKVFGKGHMTLAELEVPLCEYESCYDTSQCNNKLAQRNPIFGQETGSKFPCSCERQCLLQGTCCFDYYEVCLGIDIYQATVSLPGLIMSLGNFSNSGNDNVSQFVIHRECRSTEVVSGKQYFWFVTRCPQDVNLSDKEIELCESNDETLLSRIPVTLKANPIITFWNVHCAQCHGLDRKKVRFWETKALCSKSIRVPVSPMNIQPFIKDRLCRTIVRENLLDKPQPCKGGFQSEPTLPIPSSMSLEKGLKTQYEEKSSELCQLYLYAVEDPGNNTYRNVHCAYQINGPITTNFPFRCAWKFDADFLPLTSSAPNIISTITGLQYQTTFKYHGTTLKPPSGGSVGTFNIMFNFGDDAMTLNVGDTAVRIETMVCPRVDEVFMPYSERCVRLHCDERDRRPVNGTCRLKDKVIISEAEQPYPHGSDIFVVSIKVHGKKAVIEEVIQTQIWLSLRTLLNNTHLNLNDNNLDIHVQQISHDNTVRYDVTVHSLGTVNTFFSRLLIIFSLLSSNLNRFALTITQLCLQNFKMVNKSYENALSEYNDVISLSNVSVCPDGNIHRYFQDVEVVLDKNDLYAKINVSYFRLDNVVFQVTVEERQYVRNVTDVIVCYPYQDNTTLHCPNGSVPVERDDYRLENGSLFIIHKGLRLSPGNFSIRDDVIYVCSTYKREHKVYHVVFFNYNNIQDVLTIVTSSVSMSSLLVLLFVYSLLPEMRNIPGKIVMSLSATLLLAQSFQLLIKVPTGWLCTVVASLVHTMWLSTFMWMTMLSVDLVRSLRSMSPMAGIRSHSNLFWLYAGLAWIFPLVFVLACVLVDYFHIWDIVIGYGSDRLCWITNPNACLFIFGIPIILTLVVNGICFILTSVEIEKTTSKVATNSKSCKNESTRLGIYVRLSLIMGFSWIFCFVAAFTQIEQLWYFPIVLDGLHGFYICACFVFKPRVKKMLMVKFGFQPKKGNMKETITTENNNTV